MQKTQRKGRGIHCKLWSHIGCNGMSKNEYDNLKYKSDPWICLVCNIKNNLESLPFTQCDNTELININCTNSMRFLESLPNVDIINETLAFSDVSSNDINNADSQPPAKGGGGGS